MSGVIVIVTSEDKGTRPQDVPRGEISVIFADVTEACKTLLCSSSGRGVRHMGLNGDERIGLELLLFAWPRASA